MIFYNYYRNISIQKFTGIVYLKIQNIPKNEDKKNTIAFYHFF